MVQLPLIFNDIAGSEILLILVFMLMFFGSKSIPGIARTMGRTIRQIKDATSDIQDEIKKSSQEMKSDLNLKGIMEDTARDIQRPLDQMSDDLDNAVKYTPRKNPSHLAKGEVKETKNEVVTEERVEPTTKKSGSDSNQEVSED